METIGYIGRGLKIYRWLIYRQTFPEQVARANFPTVVSASVARIQVFDRELGSVPDFNNFAAFQLAKPNNLANGQAAAAEITEPDKEPILQETNSTEVYYDSRSGNRYRAANGNKVKLPDAGIIVISRDSRPETTNTARSTFFFAPSNK